VPKPNECFGELPIVVDLTVVGEDSLAVFAEHRLLATAEIDNLKADGPN
jgi:hypothetical protein